MGVMTWWNFPFLYSFTLIIIVSSRHIQDSDTETKPDLSKSGKPGEYLWYKTSSEDGVAKSFIPSTSHSLEQNDDSGEIPSQQEENLSGSGEPSDESSSEDIEHLSGSGSYAASYMVNIGESTDLEHNSGKPDHGAAIREHETSEDDTQGDGETKVLDSSGSANMEEGSSDGHNSENAKVKVMTPAVQKPVNPKRRSEIYSKNNVEKESDDSEYDKLFKDFGTEGDLDPGLEDEDSYLDDSLSEEEAKLLIPEEDEDDKGKSKSEISRPSKEHEELSSTFPDIFHEGKARSSKGKLKHVKSHSSVTKEILSKLDIDVFRGNHSEEHVAYHRKKHRHHKHRHGYHHEQIPEQSKEEADSSRALSHHAESGIFNGSVSNITLEAEKQKTPPKHHHKRHHHDAHHLQHHNYHHHRHHHHQHHQAQKSIDSDEQIHLQQQNPNAQYSPQLQSPSVYDPYPSPYPAQQPQMTPYQQPYQMPSSDYEYHSLQNADRQGAVCLDGSIPGYYLRKGSGTGSSKWIIYLQGGAWCDTEESCLGRSQMHLGSSLFFNPVLNPGGFLSSKKEENPKFYNWNVAFLPYCDGSSFSGNRSDPVKVEGSLLYFRGFRILDVTISELLSDTNIKDSKRVVFSGTSAGGLAVMLHADFVRSKLPKKVRFRALADSGFFLDTSSRKNKGHPKFRKEMQNIFKLHDCTDGVPQKCVDEMPGKDLWKCIFPQYFLKFVKSKMFIVNPLYDSWQLQHIWEIDCASNPYSCTKKEVKQIKKFRKATLKAMAPVFKKSNIGLFADSCVDHGQVVYNNRWNSITVREKETISSSFIKWLKSPSKRKYFIDKDKYPGNPSCVTIGVAKRSDILTEGF